MYLSRIIVFGFIFLILPAAGVILHLQITVFNEIGWRGFMEKHVALPYSQKYMFIGGVWAVYLLTGRVFSGMWQFSSVFTTILFYIAASFFMAEVLKLTKALWGPIVVHGILLSSGFWLFLIWGSNALWNETTGLFMSAIMIVLTLGFRIYSKHQSK
ncbi:MAG: hypothetical protein LUF90_03120 [Rikenellaceae bacterium]|nr:hypothetical protein [Rikenellaceae bacterium]